MGAESFYLAADPFPETCRPILKKLPTICRVSLYTLRETPIPTTQHSYPGKGELPIRRINDPQLTAYFIYYLKSDKRILMAIDLRLALSRLDQIDKLSHLIKIFILICHRTYIYRLRNSCLPCTRRNAGGISNLSYYIYTIQIDISLLTLYLRR